MEYNGLSSPKKDKMVDSPPGRHCVSHSHFDRVEKGMGHFRSSDLENNFFLFEMNTTLFCGVIGPISTANDYLN